VVPEVAARSHANAIFPCIEDVISQSGVTLDMVDYFACTRQPGLLPSLLTGLTVSQMLAEKYQKPFLPIDHIEGHVFANFLEREFSEVLFPNVTLTVS
jgi:N6-L-threonylcarbamoyladenine synthase